MTDEECKRLLKLAHDAPLNPYRLDADGHRWVEQQSYAWARASRNWMKACDDLKLEEKQKVNKR